MLMFELQHVLFTSSRQINALKDKSCLRSTAFESASVYLSRFVCALRITCSRLGLQHDCFHEFLKQLLPLIDANNVSSEYLEKHYENAHSNILKISPPKTENFLMKNSDIFHISAQKHRLWYSLEPPRRGGSNEYPQSMFLSRNKKTNVYPCKPQFYNIKII